MLDLLPIDIIRCISEFINYPDVISWLLISRRIYEATRINDLKKKFADMRYLIFGQKCCSYVCYPNGHIDGLEIRSSKHNGEKYIVVKDGVISARSFGDIIYKYGGYYFIKTVEKVHIAVGIEKYQNEDSYTGLYLLHQYAHDEFVSLSIGFNSDRPSKKFSINKYSGNAILSSLQIINRVLITSYSELHLKCVFEFNKQNKRKGVDKRVYCAVVENNITYAVALAIFANFCGGSSQKLHQMLVEMIKSMPFGIPNFGNISALGQLQKAFGRESYKEVFERIVRGDVGGGESSIV